jgi:transposase
LCHQHSAGAEKSWRGPNDWRSRGELSTKIHALVDALGNPLGFFLTGGEAHDLVGADHLLPTMAANTLIADKAFDADARVLEPLAASGKTAVIPPRTDLSSPRDYYRELHAARHLIENFFAKIGQFRAIATRHEKTARNFLASDELSPLDFCAIFRFRYDLCFPTHLIFK